MKKPLKATKKLSGWESENLPIWNVAAWCFFSLKTSKYYTLNHIMQQNIQTNVFSFLIALNLKEMQDDYFAFKPLFGFHPYFITFSSY